jgi:hypothetical protein
MHHPMHPDAVDQYVPLESTTIQIPEEITAGTQPWTRHLLLLDADGYVLGYVNHFNSRTMEYIQGDYYPNEEDSIRSIHGKAAKVLIRKAYAEDPEGYEQRRKQYQEEMFAIFGEKPESC